MLRARASVSSGQREERRRRTRDAPVAVPEADLELRRRLRAVDLELDLGRRDGGRAARARAGGGGGRERAGHRGRRGASEGRRLAAEAVARAGERALGRRRLADVLLAAALGDAQLDLLVVLDLEEAERCAAGAREGGRQSAARRGRARGSEGTHPDWMAARSSRCSS